MVRPMARPAAAAFFAGVLALGACNAAGPSPLSTAGPTLTAGASPASASPDAQSGGGTPPATATPCTLGAPRTDWTPVPAATGRCSVTVLPVAMSFAASPGWLWAGVAELWALTRDNGSTRLSTSLYGGAVVPAYCTDPPPTIPMSKATDIVAWLHTVKHLDVKVTERTVDGASAWQLDMTTGVIPSCSGDPDKGGLISLWSISGELDVLPQAMGNNEQQRVYLIERPDHLVIMTAHWIADEGIPGILSYADFLVLAEEIFASLQFE